MNQKQSKTIRLLGLLALPCVIVFMFLVGWLPGLTPRGAAEETEVLNEISKSNLPLLLPKKFKPVQLNLDVYQFNEEKQRKEWAGEYLAYQVFWNGVIAGKAELQVRRRAVQTGKEVWHVQLDVESNQALSSFYSVHVKARTALDCKGGFSRFYYLNKKEGDYFYKERIRFDYRLENLEAIHDLADASEKWYSTKIDLTGKILDPLALLYYLRSPNVTLDQTFAVCTEGQIWPVKFHVIGDALVKIPALNRSLECLVITPEYSFNGLFERRSEVRLWLHKETRIPVKATFELPIGPCEIKLYHFQHCPLDPDFSRGGDQENKSAQ